MKKTLLFSLLGLALLFACKKEQKFSRFNTRILTPLIHTSLGLDDLLDDSTLVPDPDGSLRLVSEYELYRSGINDLFEIPDSERVNTVSLKTLKLADQDMVQPVPLVMIFPQAAILDGQSWPIPAQSISTLPSIPIDASSFFKEATFNSGTMEISITNGYPVEISTLIFQLSNVVDGSVIQTDTFSNITPGSTQTKVIDLAGKKLYAQMQATPILIETAASSGPVLIDKDALTIIRLQVRDMKPQSAIARFPAQSVLSEEQTVVYNFGSAEVKKLRVRTGRVSFRVVSTIEEEMNVVYQIPYATKNGVPFYQTFTVPPAPSGASSTYITNYDISGYEIDLRGKDPFIKDTVNSFYSVLDVSIDSSGIERNISLDDSIFMYLGLLDLEPEYAEGYFGQETIQVGPETEEFDFLSGMEGKIDFEDLNFSIDIENGMGASAQAVINQLTSRNTRKNTIVALTGSGVAGPHVLPPATYPPLTPSHYSIPLNKSNSNIKAFIEHLPDKLDYDVTIQTNPNGNVNNYKDFVTGESNLVATLNVDMPMSLKADNITLSDTIDFDFFALNNSQNILEGALNVVADNGFPFEVELQLYLLDGNGMITDSLVAAPRNIIAAASADANNKITAPLRTVVVAKADQEKMKKLRATRKILVKAVINTPPQTSNYWKIYSSYTFNVSLTGDFLYDQNY